jgi:glycosyltransferase involved in cell wall biosynthesis
MKAEIRADVIVIHPYKHHALHLAAGLVHSGLRVACVFPFYRQGFGRLVAMLPGKIGRKASGYHHPGLRGTRMFYSTYWQVRKLLTFLREPKDIECPFDSFAANKILERKWQAGTIVTLQDHLPKTSFAAKQVSARLWSDQIINLSDEATARIRSHCVSLGVTWPEHDERVNTTILGLADIITVPSRYTLEGISGRMSPTTRCVTVPYGVDPKRFGVTPDNDQSTVTIVARANSVRKGGHLLLSALLRIHGELRRILAPARLKVVILGACEPALAALVQRVQDSAPGLLEHGNISHLEVPALLASSRLFVMPTLSESMSLACVEAMQAGLGMLITPYAGMDKFVDGEMGLLIEDSIDSVAEALARAVSARDQWDDWGRNARRAAQDTTWEIYEKQTAAIAAEDWRTV